uniref:Uncharacterized protein n=1 Tax=Lotharella oceanica TaxID=641309 RepID=A0A7S2XDN7_9EUKA|mmetsp:Transcript_33100/g.61519  ORF Transcript_33100/g.61519 Transcript_33100/m.61519 type:complete len:160 (+) Transcript_33100:327-806(+)
MKPLHRSKCLDVSSSAPPNVRGLSLVDDKSCVIVYDSKRKSDPIIGVMMMMDDDDLNKETLVKSPTKMSHSVASPFESPFETSECEYGAVAHVFPDAPVSYLVDMFADDERLRLLVVHDVQRPPKLDPIYKELGYITREELRGWAVSFLATPKRKRARR